MSNKNTDLIAPLVEAANAIVKVMRDTAKELDQSVGEVRIPIIVGGTGMRVTIEHGPRTAASNAIEVAQREAGGEPAMRLDDAIRIAADLLSCDAMELKAAHTIDGEWPPGEEAVRDHHDEMLRVVHALNRGTR